MSSFIQVSVSVDETSAVSDSVYEAFAAMFQEVFILIVFAASFYFWKCFRHSYRVPCKSSKQVKGLHADPSPKNLARRNASGPVAPKPIEQEKVKEAEAEIISLLERREFTTALNTFRMYERKGMHRYFINEAMYSGFIQSAVRIGKLDVMERMLQQIVQNRMTPSTEFWHSTLKLLSSRKHFASCHDIFATCGEILPNDKVIFSCLINAALESGTPDKAASMIGHYKKCCLEPSDFVTVFRTYVAVGEVNDAEKLFRELNANLTPLMLNLVLLACINNKEPERAMDLVFEAHRYEASSGDTSSRIVDSVSYNTVIKGFVAADNVSRCFKCLESMQEHNLQPDDVTLTTLLDISFTESGNRMTDHLVSLLTDCTRTTVASIGTCNIFIKGLIRRDHLAKAVEVYEAIKQCSGIQPSIITYSMIIKALVDAHDLERALFVVEDMTAAGEAPDEIIFTHLLEGCHLVGNFTLGERIFSDMSAAGVRPSDYTLTTMLKLYGRGGMHDKARELVANWEAKYGGKPSVIHYTCLMSGCLRSKQFDRAWAAYLLMQERGIAIDDLMVTTLMPAMVTAQKFDCVLQLTRQVLQEPRSIAVPTSALNKAVAQMSLLPNTEKEIQEMKLLMRAAGVERPPWKSSQVRQGKLAASTR